MPEGHTLHRLARRHRSLFGGREVGVSSPQGRFAAGAAAVDGMVLKRSEAHGKHLFHHYSYPPRLLRRLPSPEAPDRVVHVHLGLYGTFDDAPAPVPEPRGQVRMRMVGADAYADLRGATTCELITAVEARAIRAGLGPDPLRRDADPDRAWMRISRSRAPLATLLMDQSVVAGIGNVYRAETLFRHGLDPQVPGSALTREEWDALWADLVALMRDGVRTGRIDTVAREHDPRRHGRAARRDRHGGEVYVYRRTGMPCLVCGAPVAHVEHAGRNLFWCPACQPARP